MSDEELKSAEKMGVGKGVVDEMTRLTGGGSEHGRGASQDESLDTSSDSTTPNEPSHTPPPRWGEKPFLPLSSSSTPLILTPRQSLHTAVRTAKFFVGYDFFGFCPYTLMLRMKMKSELLTLPALAKVEVVVFVGVGGGKMEVAMGGVGGVGGDARGGKGRLPAGKTLGSPIGQVGKVIKNGFVQDDTMDVELRKSGIDDSKISGELVRNMSNMAITNHNHDDHTNGHQPQSQSNTASMTLTQSQQVVNLGSFWVENWGGVTLNDFQVALDEW